MSFLKRLLLSHMLEHHLSTITTPSPHHLSTITTPSIHHYSTITTPSIHHYNTIYLPLQHHHHTITIPSPHHHHTITTPSLHHCQLNLINKQTNKTSDTFFTIRGNSVLLIVRQYNLLLTFYHRNSVDAQLVIGQP